MALNYETLKASLVLYGLNAVSAIVLLIVGWYLSTVAQQFVSRMLTAAHRVDPLVSVFLSSLARYAVLAVVGIAVLQLFGIQTASLVAVLGATSLAIGLALQGTLSNLAAGVMLLLFRPFRIGDDVEVAGKAGKVRALSLFMTELVTPDNTQVLLPNGSVWGSAIVNHSTYPGTGEVKVSFPVRAGRSIKQISEQVLEKLRADPGIGAQQVPEVHVSKVVNVSDAVGPVVELTVSAKVNPAEADAVKQRLLDEISSLLSDIVEPATAENTQ
ncbi:small-conductance mechanosensitive channel [Bradyrhizobium macuxiense]|uniref:Small-conductance mechanosensitive channel n=1 Tax=Bradyrhizobium macuxiense TaxID=1755647 RepID=A0A120FPI6_9BRAD|nr:mechanosensitive ion channel domain-containing protein [Bradyrhizobium macuxiense]KWV57047.1 small-conductance mechanosensitive channel [Bradyrhizobium macuxiense]